jgi:hypothetical protein
MAEAAEVIVPPSLPRLLASLVVGVLCMVGGLLMLLGPRLVLIPVAPALGGMALLVFVLAVVRRRPRVVITAEGFTVHKLFGEESHEWRDVHGSFAVIKIGISKAVGYHLTTDYKARTGRKSASRFSGYDAAISGAFALPADKLAELLNAHHRNAS